MTSVFKNILVPFNGTKGSQKAFNKAVPLASSVNASIFIFTCIEKRQIFSFFKFKASNEEFEKERKIVEKQHIEMKTFAQEKGVSCSSNIIKGDHASSEILNFADKHKIDLIIMTRTKFSSHKERIHYQSTLEDVFRNTICPILILT